MESHTSNTEERQEPEVNNIEKSEGVNLTKESNSLLIKNPLCM